ncbi:MAG: hypothetical protein GWP10_12215, partial [Nitrospiraceae bacterium]|nr:hypothetical protein [Nitrospiraceae bacterium]
MAVYGVGFHYGGYDSQKERFLKEGKVCTDWPEDKGKYFCECMRRMNLGDIVFLKSFSINKQTLDVYAIGLVKEGYQWNERSEGCVKVKWLWKSKVPYSIPIKDGFVGRNTTVYEEINPEVIG